MTVSGSDQCGACDLSTRHFGFNDVVGRMMEDSDLLFVTSLFIPLMAS